MTDKASEIWLKAAAAGSLWASVEIVIGSFFHNLRMPFAGTFLAVMGISLMIGFQYKWKDTGLIWRAGLICAIMKSLSPSAVILGPMIGILTEALILELFIRWLGRNPAGFILGSVAAVFSALLHKAGSLLILYGFDIVTILENIYRFAEKQLGFKGPEPGKLLLILVLVYIAFGLFAGIIGMLAGNKLLKTGTDPEKPFQTTGSSELIVMDAGRYSLGLLGLHFFALVALLLLINNAPLSYAAAAVIPYLLFVFSRYRKALRRLSKPVFWIQLFVILVTAVLFWNEYATGVLLNKEGLQVGVRMILRALIVVIVFSSVSVELRNPLVKTILYKKGFAQLYSSLNLAFSILPGIIEKTAKPGMFLLRPVHSLAGIIQNSDDILISFKSKMHEKPPVFIIAGNQREGKTTFLKETISELKRSNCIIDGIMALGIDENSERSGFRLIDIKTGEQMLLCTTRPHENWPKTGKFYFNPDSIEFGNDIISKIPGSSIGVIDEVGPLEMDGEGWDASLKRILEEHKNPLILVIRRNLTQEIIRKYHLENVVIMDIARYKPKELADMIRHELVKK